MSLTDPARNLPLIPPEVEHEEIAALSRWLTDNEPAILVGRDGDPVPIPGSIRDLLRLVVQDLARGHAVLVEPVRMEVSVRQAADLLNVSHGYLANLLDTGVVPYIETSGRRRLRLREVVALKVLWSQECREGLRQLSELSQELGE